ncbi:MAG: hypothetical protein OEM18_05355 [Nitrosopumilus sp.]|jgi:hypothetical protein|nr:hypothetical protein [Nitrosopumilus sp.]MDH3501411.1 hypothetical protein [Nitrosopumilus sp.]
MDPDFSWIYLIFFLIIPLSRIIPRILAKRKIKGNATQTIKEKQFQPSYDEFSGITQKEFSKPQTKTMLVLGELNRGVKTFQNIQKNTGLDTKELDMILQDLEKNELLRVEQKQGLFGPKIELYPTDKGFREYYT